MTFVLYQVTSPAAGFVAVYAYSEQTAFCVKYRHLVWDLSAFLASKARRCAFLPAKGLLGTACRMLAKQVQTELAQANAVADEVLATMTTVRAHAADDSAKAAYGVKLAKFYVLQVYLDYTPNWAHLCSECLACRDTYTCEPKKAGTEPQPRLNPSACNVCPACIIPTLRTMWQLKLIMLKAPLYRRSWILTIEVTGIPCLPVQA